MENCLLYDAIHDFSVRLRIDSYPAVNQFQSYAEKKHTFPKASYRYIFSHFLLLGEVSCAMFFSKTPLITPLNKLYSVARDKNLYFTNSPYLLLGLERIFN